MVTTPATSESERRQFARWLRTGRLSDGSASAEFKFNPWHDPDDGRFTFAHSGRYFGPGTGAASPNPPATARLPAPARAQPAPAAAARAGAGDASGSLGTLSAAFESGKDGVATVSTGRTHGGAPDRGGPSYGSYQLTSQTIKRVHGQDVIVKGGSVSAFLQAEGSRWAAEFAGQEPGSAAFTRTWRAIAARDPAALRDREHAFVKRTVYDPAVDRIPAATGIDLDRAPQPIRNALWSAAVQLGAGSLATKNGAVQIFADAIRDTRNHIGAGDRRYFEALADEIYARRKRYWPPDASRYQVGLGAVLAGLRR